MQIWGRLRAWLRGDGAEAGDSLAVDAALREVQRWREQLVHGLLLALVYVGPLALAFSAYGAFVRGRIALVIAYVLAYVAVLVFAFWRKVPYRMQVLGVLGLIYLLGLSDLLVFGWKEDARLFFLTLALLTSLFYGVAQGFLALGLAMLTLVSIGMLGVSGVLPLPPVTEPYRIGLVPVSLLSDTASLALLSTMLIVLQRYLTPRFIATVVGSRQRVGELELQQTEMTARLRTIQTLNYALQERISLLEGTVAVGRELTGLLDLNSLLSRAPDLIAGAFSLYHVGIYLPADEGGALQLRAVSSEAGQQLLAEGYCLDLEAATLAEVWSARRGYIAMQTATEGRWRLSGSRSAALLPLNLGERVLGVLDLQSIEEEAFEAGAVRALEALAGQLAVALDNARRVSREATLLEATSPFYRLAQRFSTAETAQEIYGAILETVREHGPHRAFILMVSDDLSRGVLVAELRGAELRFPELGGALASWLERETLLPEALDLERPLLIADVSNPPPEVSREALAQLVARAQLYSLALVPIRVKERLLGVLGITFNVLHVFSPAEEQLYQTLVGLSGAALQRLLLVHEAERRVEMERQLRRFSDQLANIFDVQLLAAQAAQTLQTLVSADGVVVSLLPSTGGMEETL